MGESSKKCLWRVGRMAWSGLLCVGLLSGQAFARPRSVVEKDKSTPSASAKTVDPKTGAEATAKPVPDGKVVRKRIDTTVRDHPFELDSNAKLVCDQTTVTAEPVWQGLKKLTFTFHLRNAGTADLKIKAKGG